MLCNRLGLPVPRVAPLFAVLLALALPTGTASAATDAAVATTPGPELACEMPNLTARNLGNALSEWYSENRCDTELVVVEAGTNREIGDPESYPEGLVVAQDPPAGTDLLDYNQATITVLLDQVTRVETGARGGVGAVAEAGAPTWLSFAIQVVTLIFVILTFIVVVRSSRKR